MYISKTKHTHTYRKRGNLIPKNAKQWYIYSDTYSNYMQHILYMYHCFAFFWIISGVNRLMPTFTFPFLYYITRVGTPVHILLVWYGWVLTTCLTPIYFTIYNNKNNPTLLCLWMCKIAKDYTYKYVTLCSGCL